MSFLAENEVPSGTINSTTGSDGNNLFTLANIPNDLSLLAVYSAGLRKTRFVDYVAFANSIVFISGSYPLAGDTLLVDYPWDIQATGGSTAISPSFTQITDHVAQAQARLIQQYVDKPQLLKLVAVFAGRTQLIENALWALNLARKLANATASQLDGIGRIVGLSRSQIPSASDDAVYRVWLTAWIKVNYSSGTIPDLIALFIAIASSGTSIQVLNSGTAAVRVQLGNVVQTQGPSLVAILANVKAAGVYASLDYFSVNPGFGLDGAGAGMDVGYLGGSV